MRTNPILVPTQWDTIKDKQKFILHFKRFVERGFPQNLFTKKFYNRVSVMRSHIAHYDREGFWCAQFESPRKRADFLHHWRTYPVNGDPAFTWSDVEKELSIWLKQHSAYEAYERKTHREEVEKYERSELARLKAKYEETK